MKLVYLWIENYQCIKEQGYLLNANYDVRYIREKNKLLISKKDNIDSLLYGNKISITAIVGDNGAGKSTLLDAIRIVLFDKTKREKELTGFLLWEEAGDLKLFPFMEGIINVETAVDINKGFLDDFSMIYYSDFLDIKYYLEEFDSEGNEDIYFEDLGHSLPGRGYVQSNISTSYLIKQNDSSVLDYFHSDTKRQMNFYGNLRELPQPLPFPVPKSLSVKIEFLEINIFDRVLDASLQAYEYMGIGHHGELNTTAYVIGLLKKMEKAYQKKTIRNIKPVGVLQILQWDIFITYIYNLLAYRKRQYKEIHDYNQVDEIIKRLISIESDEDTIWKELDRIFSQESTENENFEDYLNFYCNIDRMRRHSESGYFCVNFSIPDNMMQILSEHDPFSYILPIMQKEQSRSMEDIIMTRFPEEYMNKNGWNGNRDWYEFMDFYDSYMKISYEIDFLKCSWGMSSGESSMFNLFARLHEALLRWKKDNIILIFDELDSSFHPQWQQQIINSLTRFLQISYPQKEFQLILTTHSPVLLSDIPRENVIFIRKENTVQVEHTQTFAANIASLYYDSFFMENGSIGEVARRSVGHLLEAIFELEEKKQIGALEEERGLKLFKLFLQKQYPGTEERILNQCMVKSEKKARILLQMLIDSIGEDIWRYKANERFHHFLGDERDRKKEIFNQLNELKKKEGTRFVQEFLKQWLREEEQ